jgi:hypothetical protein
MSRWLNRRHAVRRTEQRIYSCKNSYGHIRWRRVNLTPQESYELWIGGWVISTLGLVAVGRKIWVTAENLNPILWLSRLLATSHSTAFTVFRGFCKIAKSYYSLWHFCMYVYEYMHACMSVHSSVLSVNPSTWKNSAPTGKIFKKFDIWVFFENLSRKFKFH